MTNRIYLKDLISEFKAFTDWKYDPWGSCMTVLFDVCAHIDLATPENAEVGFLEKVEYRAGAAGSCVEDDHWEYLLDDAHLGDVIRFGCILERYRSKLVVAGKDY